MTLNISDDLKPAEASELVELARKRNQPLGLLLLEAARALAGGRVPDCEPRTANRELALAGS